MEKNLISGIIKQFNYYKTVGDKTIAQLSFEDMSYQPNAPSNSISIIVNHMVGNMLSRWTVTARPTPSFPRRSKTVALSKTI